MRSLRRALKELDLRSWDNWVPLAVIAAFIGVGILTAFGVVNVVGSMDASRFRTIYDSIGLRTTAGILPTVVSLSLVAIQFASNQYTHRIMVFYIRSITFWSVIIVYLAMILLVILMGANINEDDDPRLAGVIIVGTILALSLLIPHFLITASFLKPDFIIGKLLRRVDKDYLLSIQRALADGRGRIDSNSDRLLPLIEIVESAIKRGDRATTRMAMEQIITTYMTQAEQLSLLSIEQYFLSYLLRIGRKAVSVPDEEEAAVHAVQIIGVVGAQGPGGSIAVEHIRDLGLAANRRGIDPVVLQMIDSLREVFEKTELSEAKKQVLGTFETLGQELAASGKRRASSQLATNLAAIGSACLAKSDLATVRQCLDMLEVIGHETAVHELVDVVVHVVKLLHALGVTAIQQDVETSEHIVRTLQRIEGAIRVKEREAIAATAFARGDIERMLKARALQAQPVMQGAPMADSPAPAPQQLATQETDGEGFSDLWSEHEP